MPRGGRKRAGPVLTIVVISILGVVALALVSVALRVEPVNNAGATPAISAYPTETPPSASATPSPSPDTGDVPAIPDTAFIDFSDAGFGARATGGRCGGEAPSVEVSLDAGVSWAAAPFNGDVSVGQILSISVPSDGQIDLAVLTASDCALSTVSSYTGGQFWQAYPERLNQLSYLDPREPSAISVAGVVMDAPCIAPLQLATSTGVQAVRCRDEIVAQPGTGNPWQTLAPLSARSITLSENSAGNQSVVAALNPALDCAGLTVSAFELDGSTPGGERTTCVSVNDSNGPVALSSSGAGSLWLWAGALVYRSADGGQSWAIV